MATVFCSHCGYIVARGAIDDPERAVHGRGLAACPGCGAGEGIGWSSDDLSDEELRRFVGPDSRRLAREALGGSPRSTPGRWLLQIGLVMLVVGTAAGGFAWYRGEHWAWAVAIGVLAGFTAGWIADRFIESPDLD